MRNKLTEKNINQIRILLLDKSISISSIAKQVGCSVQVIHNYAKKYYWDTTRDKLSREKLLSNKQIKERIIKLHNYFYSKSYQNKKFIFNFVEENDSVLASYIGRHKIPWIKILKISGLDPSCHIGQFSYGYNEKQKKESFKKIIYYIKDNFGLASLNDNSMNSSEKFPLPETFGLSIYSEICVSAGCSRFELTLRSVYATGRRFFKTWRNALSFCGIEPDTVERKKEKYDEIEIVKMLDNFDKQTNGNWSITSIREKNHKLERAIYNLKTKINNNLPYKDNSDDIVFIVWMNLIYFRKNGLILEDQKWWDDNYEQLYDNYLINHKQQENWTDDKIILGVQEIYSRGPDTSRLTRSNVLENDFEFDKKVWSAMRQSRFRKSGFTEEQWLKKSGFLPKNLRKIYDEIDAPFTTKQIFNKFCQLMKLSLDTGQNCLTREYCEKKEKVFHNYVILRYKSWEKGLEFYGLDPKFFSITLNKRTKRGYQFQKFVEEKFNQIGLNKVKDLKESNDFISNMLIKNCDHKIKCKPDFLFENFIIDTKAGYHASQKPDQLKRYFDHKKKVYVLVLKGKSRKEYIDNAIIEVINYHDFVKQSEEIIGLKIDPSTESELTQVLKQNPFWS